MQPRTNIVIHTVTHFGGAGNFRGQKGGRACLPSPITRIGRDFNPVVVVVLSYHDYIDFRFAMTQL